MMHVGTTDALAKRMAASKDKPSDTRPSEVRMQEKKESNWFGLWFFLIAIILYEGLAGRTLFGGP
jgi:hypothetical protein